MMTSRERVLCALNHEEPDRVPLFLGTSGVTSILGPGYPKLRQQLGLPSSPTRWLSRQFQYVQMDEDVLEILGSDGRPVMPGAASSTLRRDISADCLIDDWGCTWNKRAGVDYFEITEAPLRHATLDDLDRYPWPDMLPSSRLSGMAERCQAVQQAGFASVVMTGVTLFEQACLLRGMEECLLDLLGDQDFFLALQERIKRVSLPYLRELSRQVGPYADIMLIGDDLGSQDSTLLSPELYRRLIKPHEAELLSVAHEHSAAKIFFHTCGNIHTLIGDLIDIGVDILNPVQVSAGAMRDTAALKRDFGAHLSFCGGIDTRQVLPCGTTEDVRAEVRRRIHDLAPGGGYIAAAVHCIQPDVPTKNVVAMCQAVHEFGQYPLV